MIKLKPCDKLMCEENLTMEDCANTVSSLKNGKSPGTDGFTAEFNKFFWPDIKGFVLDS